MIGAGLLPPTIILKVIRTLQFSFHTRRSIDYLPMLKTHNNPTANQQVDIPGCRGADCQVAPSIDLWGLDPYSPNIRLVAPRQKPSSFLCTLLGIQILDLKLIIVADGVGVVPDHLARPGKRIHPACTVPWPVVITLDAGRGTELVEIAVFTVEKLAPCTFTPCGSLCHGVVHLIPSCGIQQSQTHPTHDGILLIGRDHKLRTSYLSLPMWGDIWPILILQQHSLHLLTSIHLLHLCIDLWWWEVLNIVDSLVGVSFGEFFIQVGRKTQVMHHLMELS